MTFDQLPLDSSIQDGLKASNFLKPTPIQEKSIPQILEGKDVIGSAQTGTGKTGAFVIPLLQHIVKSEKKGTRALILTPTRELANQIDEQIFAIGYHTGISSATIIGGSDFSAQAKAIRAGVNVMVATPGRLLDQMKVMQLDFSSIDFLILDEADRMLDMGFLPDVRKIITQLPANRQTLLFSATLPPQLQKLVSEFMKNPVRVNVATSKPADNIKQIYYRVYEADKIHLIKNILDEFKPKNAIVFCSTKKGTDSLDRNLRKNNMASACMHGDRSQQEREDALMAFKNGVTNILVATDVIARGIDIDDVGMVINYDCPKQVDDYIHRIGRTGRKDAKGVAVTLVSPKDKRLFKNIIDFVGKSLNEYDLPDALKVPKTLGNRAKNETHLEKKSTPKTTRSSVNPKVKKEDSKKPTPKKESPKKAKITSKESVAQSKPDNKKTVVVDRVTEASNRLKKNSKPSKGIWGLIKAIIGL